MPGRKVKDVVEKLTGKFGFKKNEKQSNNHIWYTKDVEGVGRMATKFSYGETEISDDILTLQARQLWVLKKYYEAMLDCSKSNADWEKKIKESPDGPLAQLARDSQKKRTTTD